MAAWGATVWGAQHGCCVGRPSLVGVNSHRLLGVGLRGGGSVGWRPSTMPQGSCLSQALPWGRAGDCWTARPAHMPWL